MKALGLNQAYILLKLRYNYYYIVLICFRPFFVSKIIIKYFCIYCRKDSTFLGRRQKNLSVVDWSVKRGGGQPPFRNQNMFFFSNKKGAECSDTEKYAKIFCEIFAGDSVKTLEIFNDIFLKYWNFSFWTKVFSKMQSIRMRPFWIFWYENQKNRFFTPSLMKNDTVICFEIMYVILK